MTRRTWFGRVLVAVGLMKAPPMTFRGAAIEAEPWTAVTVGDPMLACDSIGYRFLLSIYEAAKRGGSDPNPYIVNSPQIKRALGL